MTTSRAQRQPRGGQGSIYKRCGCRDANGHARGTTCPLLATAGHGSWYWTTELGRDEQGRRRRRRRGGFPTRQAALRALAQARTACTTEQPVGVTTDWWLRTWLARRVQLRPSTRRMYQSHMRNYLGPVLGRIPLSERAPDHVRMLIARIADDHEAERQRIKPATVIRILATLRAAMNAAVRDGLLARNPVALVELPPLQRPHPRVWTPARVAAWQATGARPAVAVWTAEQTARFLAAARGDPLYPLLHLIALRGLRRGEAAGLTWEAVDLGADTVEIYQQVLEVGGRLVLGPPKSQASRRTVTLDADTAQVLARHRTALVNPVTGFLLSNRSGGPVRPKRLTSALSRIAADAGLPPVRLHDLRHGAASLALAAGADLKVVQEMLGHASIVLTADTYTSVLPTWTVPSPNASRHSSAKRRLTLPDGSAEVRIRWDRAGPTFGPTGLLQGRLTPGEW